VGVDPAFLAEKFPHISQIEPLRSGGQKWVFRCHHPQHGPCALKLMKPGAELRLDRELEAVQRLSSGSVPQVYDVGRIDTQMGECVWLLEGFIDGSELSDRLSEGVMTKGQLLNLALDLISAAADAETAQVVHRDIKPDNIKIDATGKAWLLDFGIARILDLQSITPTAQPMGPHTPGYSPPEQFKYSKREIDGRSDLFAIGVVLYQCATGTNPFLEGARDRMEILRRVEHEPLPRLDLEWDVEGRFADFVSALTQKYPYQRVPSCVEALAWLREIIDSLGGL
jgi:serine/threonine protein kinase